jgi:hypothetical protein
VWLWSCLSRTQLSAGDISFWPDAVVAVGWWFALLASRVHHPPRQAKLMKVVVESRAFSGKSFEACMKSLNTFFKLM